LVIAEKAFWFRALDCPRPPAAARARRAAAVILVGAVTALPETASPEGKRLPISGPPDKIHDQCVIPVRTCTTRPVSDDAGSAREVSVKGAVSTFHKFGRRITGQTRIATYWYV
jgi:hypothetical protein